MERLTGWLSNAYNSAVEKIEPIKNNLVADVLDGGSDVARSATNIGLAYGISNVVCLAGGAAFGSAIGDVQTGMILGATFALVATPVAMLGNVEADVMGNTLGDVVQERMWEAHDRHISENNMDRDYITQIGNAKHTPLMHL